MPNNSFEIAKRLLSLVWFVCAVTCFLSLLYISFDWAPRYEKARDIILATGLITLAPVVIGLIHWVIYGAD